MRRAPTNSFYNSQGGLLRSALSLGGEKDISAFEEAFADYIGVRRAFLVGSGTSALYIILKALKNLYRGSEVVLPAYTVPTLTLAIERAGLKTRLSDIDIKTFNLDPKRLGDVTSGDTLSVVPVHMFGFPMDLSEIKRQAEREGFCVIEDCAQAPGAELFGKRVGGGSGVGFFSMCKGKIISTFRGGVITASDPDIAREIGREIESLPTPGVLFNPMLFVTLFLMHYATNPAIYGPLFRLIEPFKSTVVHEHFEPTLATSFVARLGKIQIEAIGGQIERRVENGKALYSALKGIEGITLPAIVDGASPAYNHLPVMIEEKDKIDHIARLLFKRGIDTARMYGRPIHKIYDLGYSASHDPFPEATRLSERLLVLPVHPGVTGRDLEIVIKTFREIFV
ncbi:MAG: DegT/DnrJ/EryC1/StrS family aminotransferase [Deltaproteobacteria bacterium]|uniref:DegT/DnrJ/EryC1/StrS family aminotransferase n=1 Tax=Candidatus Zymogenus saltonus TaxID=2844893 RepID=A0A9D8KGC2_9DELT|nr:DegT/DnrJ/EryC1/StrS family aminotransferase [Candidatus Zymogenus saltonus]